MKKHFLLALMTLLPFMGAWAGNVGTFAELKDALAAGGEVTLTADIEVTEALHVNRAVTLDLNGQTITVADLEEPLEEPFIVNRLGVLTVTDGATGGTIDASNVMLGIKMTDASDKLAQGVAELIVNGGTIKGKNYGISGNGSEGRGNTKVTINGGSIIASEGTGIYNPQTGELNINGGYIEGLESAVEVRSGNLNMSVTGGELVAKATEYSCNPNGNGTTTKGAALAIAQHTTQNPIAIVIKGGSFTGEKALSVANPQNNGYEDVKVSVLDGTFNGGVVVENVGDVFNQQFVCGGTFADKSVENYLVNGCTLQANGNGTYSVKGYDVVITLGNIEVAYGNPIPPFTANYFSYVARSNGQELDVNTLGFTKDDLFAAMEFQMIDTPEGDPAAQGSYRYTTPISSTFKEAHPAINNVGGNNGNVNILKRNFNNNQDDLKVIFSPNPIEDQTYTGREIKPEVTVEFLGQTLVAGTDYTVAYENNVNVTTADAPAYVVLTGAGKNYTGTAKLPFQIVPVAAAADDIAVVVEPARYTYTGEEIVPEKVTVTYKGTELTANDFDIDYANIDKVNAGEKPFTVSLKGTYSGSKVAYYYIDPVDVATLDITATNAQQYTSQAIKATVTVKFGDKTLTAGKDYTVEFANNINAGDKAEAIVKGVENSNFTGTKTVYYTINKRDLSTTGIQNDEPKLKALTWNGEKQQAEITSWSFYGKQIPALLENPLKVTYVYQVIDNSQEVDAITDAGIYKVIFTADENEPNFTGSKTVTIEVAKAELTAKVKDIEVAFGTTWESKYELENVAVANGGELTEKMEAAVKEFATADKFSVALGQDGIAHVGEEYPISFDAGNGTENFTIRVVDGALTVTAAEVWAEIDVYHQNSNDNVSYERSADAPNPYVLSYGEEYELGLKYDSGLEGIVVDGDITAAEYFATLIAGQNVAFVVKDSEGKVIEGSHPENAGTYDVSVAAFQAGDYIVYTKDDQFVIEGIDISKDLTVDVELEDCVYNGTQWKPGKDALVVTYKDSEEVSEEVEDFEIIGYGENLNAGEGTVEIKVSNGNMEGTATGRFDIRKREIVIKAEDDEASYADVVNKNAKYEKGAVVIVDEDEEITEENAADDIAVKELAELLKNPEYVEVKLVNGVPTSAGNHPEALEATLIASEEALAASAFKNYVIVKTQRGTLDILKQDLVLKVKNFEFVYGDPVVIPADYQPEYVSGLISSSQEAALYSSIVKNLQFEVAAPADEDNGKYVVGKEYAITASATATNYNVVFNDDAVVTISKRPVTVKPSAQEVEYGKEIDPTGYEITKGTLGYEDDDLGITVETTVTSIGEHKNAITVNVSAANPNYDITVVDYDEENQGAPVKIGATEFVLHRVGKTNLDNPEKNDAAQLIADYDGQTVEKVRIEHDGATMKLTADKWYALVLPFDVTIRELNKKFGYVVVNVFDVNNTNKKQISFKLELNSIPANTPFVFKVDEGEEGDVRDLNNLTFENKTIVNGGPVVYVGDASGMKFIGSYTGKIGFKSNEYYFQISTALDGNKYYSGNDTNTTLLRPCGAYLSEELAAGEEAGTRTIIFQESDGSLTTVKAIDANTFVNAEGWYTIEGKKLEAVPTQKGVYINNGKKVVIK